MDYIRNNSLRNFNLTPRFLLPTLRSQTGKDRGFGLLRKNLVTKYMLLNFTSISKPFSSPFCLSLSPFILLHLTKLQEIKKSIPSIKHTTFDSIRIWVFRHVFRFRFQIQKHVSKFYLTPSYTHNCQKLINHFFPTLSP